MQLLSNLADIGFRLQELKTLSLRMNAQYVVEIHFFPSRFLGPDELARFHDDIVTIASNAVSAPPSYGIFSSDPHRYDHRIITIIRERKTGRPVACSAMAHFKVDGGRARRAAQDVFHLGLILIDKAYQRKNLQFQLYAYANIVIWALNFFRPVWISSVSAVPAIIGAVAQNYHKVYPNYAVEGPAPEPHRAIARSLLSKRKDFGTGDQAVFDADRFIIRNSFDDSSLSLKSSYEAVAKFRDQRCNSYCRERIDYERGDELLQIGQIHVSSVLRAVWRLVTRPRSAEA
jgi:hypothetical protein